MAGEALVQPARTWRAVGVDEVERLELAVLEAPFGHLLDRPLGCRLVIRRAGEARSVDVGQVVHRPHDLGVLLASARIFALISGSIFSDVTTGAAATARPTSNPVSNTGMNIRSIQAEEAGFARDYHIDVLTLYCYRPEVLDELARHGLQPAGPIPTPSSCGTRCASCTSTEIRRLKARLLAGEFPKSEYAGRVIGVAPSATRSCRSRIDLAGPARIPIDAGFREARALLPRTRIRPRRAGADATPILYDSRDLVTHAVCVGMTGSGKTGLCLALLEEAAIDGVPVIAIDPEGGPRQPAADLSRRSRPGDFAPGSTRRRRAARGRRRTRLPQAGRDVEGGARRLGTGRRPHRAPSEQPPSSPIYTPGQPRRPAGLGPQLVQRASGSGP